MELQFGLAIVDEMNGGEEAWRRMQGWMHRESRAARRVRAVAAGLLAALARRRDAEAALGVPLQRAGEGQASGA